jgi:hypothetical protein
MSLLEVVEAMVRRSSTCAFRSGPAAAERSGCAAHSEWAEAQAALVKVLGKASIAQLAINSISNLAKLHRVSPRTEWRATHRGRAPADEDGMEGNSGLWHLLAQHASLVGACHGGCGFST